MTGKTSTGTDTAFAFSDDDKAAIRMRALRMEQILDGALPRTAELLEGLPPCKTDLQADVMAYIDAWRLQRTGGAEPDGGLAVALEAARADASRDAITALRAALEGEPFAVDFILRCDIWLAALGEPDGHARTVRAALDPGSDRERSGIPRLCRIAFAIGLTWRRSAGGYAPDDASDPVSYGAVQLQPLIDLVRPLLPALIDGDAAALLKLIADEKPERQDANTGALDGTDATHGTLTALRRDADEDDTGAGRVPRRVVVPALPEGGSGGTKDIRKSWRGLAGRPLPLVSRGDVAGHRRALVERWPHAADVIDIVLGDLAASEAVRFRPTLLTGEPGSGKSSLVRAICGQVGLPCQLVPMAGLADASMMGTSAQWATARESAPLQLVKTSRTASVAMIWDEIEKAGDGRHNGNAIEALLPMLEIEQARKYRDLALEVEVDLSMVSHFATANSTQGIPGPVRDRFRILQMPEPGWQHLGPLTRQIIDRIAVERGVDRRWYPGLAEDELDLVRQVWPGGSIRQLTRIVTILVDGRDRLMGRC
ncbi:AAA family ATPase [Pelagibacterium halotolerans]|uniref:AAA family ATPase n=1 Tax=Pelagibacterium halotolerans TaxID=531813 RepID=UPI00384F4B06